MKKEGKIVLEDGTFFEGVHLNDFESIGEVVFNTSHSGYEEMATDPSYYKQILVCTAPMQGNYGVHQDFQESEQIQIAGFICLEMQNSKRDSSWLDRLSQNKVSVLEHVDTRNLVIHLREKGSLWGGVFSSSVSNDEALKKIQKEKQAYVDADWTKKVSTKKIYKLEGQKKSGHKVGVLDFGCKKNILRELQKRCAEVVVFPSETKKDQIDEHKVDGLLLSNGPGDPANVKEPLEVIQSLIGSYPLFGICMGHQLLGRALGASTYKLKFGHRGANHPIKETFEDEIVFMSSQNHGYALKDDFDSKGDIKVTHYNLNDQSVAGIQSEKNKCFSVQFHPENCPGPMEATVLFDRFFKSIEGEHKKMNKLSGVEDAI